MPSNAILHEAQQLHAVSDRLDSLSGQRTLVSDALLIQPGMGRIDLNQFSKHGDLAGRVPSLSLEITCECPLRCSGCYVYEDANLGTTNLRSLSDFRGQELIRRVRERVQEHKPLHLSIVGDDPLVFLLRGRVPE